MKTFASLASLLLFPLATLCAGISGTYHVHGKNPDGTNYKGHIVIEKDGPIYKSEWTLNDGSSVGTGVYKDGFLAFDFVGVDAQSNPIVGVQLYQVYKNELKGPWTVNGTGTRGFEVAEKEHHAHSSHCSSS